MLCLLILAYIYIVENDILAKSRLNVECCPLLKEAEKNAECHYAPPTIETKNVEWQFNDGIRHSFFRHSLVQRHSGGEHCVHDALHVIKV